MANNTSNYALTIIVPVYNEEENMVRLENTLLEFLPKSLKKACVLFVDDGSRDRSLVRIRECCTRNEDFFYISFEKNRGLSAALKAGIDYTESKFLAYMDADLQTAPEDLNLLMEQIDKAGCEMAIGIRAKRKDTFFKKLQSKIANGWRRMMTGDGALDTGCPLKVLRTDAAKKLPLFKGMHRFLPALILLQDGGRYVQVPVRHFPREAGKSKYHLWNRLWGPFIDCFAYRWMRSRYINYRIKEGNLR